MLEFALRLSQAVGHRPQGRGIDAEPDMAGQIHLDVLSGSGGPQEAGTPVHDAVGAGIDRGGRDRQVAGDRFPDLRDVVDPSPDSAS